MKTQLWILNETHSSIFDQSVITSEELVEEFLKRTRRWYIDPPSGLFGYERMARARITDTINNVSPPPVDEDDYRLIYIEVKFQNEWIGPRGAFRRQGQVNE
jgi:hypothetical protein